MMVKVMELARIKGNLEELPEAPKRRKGKRLTALRSWTIGGVGEAIAFWALHKARFWRVVKSLLLQYKNGDGITKVSSFISPNQLRQGLCFLPSYDERYYRRKFLTDEQIKLTFRWDFLALKKENKERMSSPCLIEVKTQSTFEPSEDYRLFKKRDFSKEKTAGFQIFCLRIVLKENWGFEAIFEKL